jgi:flagellar hook-associated protein 3 FlgL
VRIPNINIQRQSLAGIQSNMRAADQAVRELTSGLRVARPSDDPAAARSILRTNADLAGNAQYTRNISRAQSLARMEDVVLDQLGDVLTRARELSLSQAGSTANAETRAATAREVEEILSFVRDLGNARIGDRYLFGGTEASRPPFDAAADPPPPLPTVNTPVEIGPGRTLAPNASAAQIFGDSGVLASLEALAEGLRSNDPDAIRGAEGALNEAFSQVQILVGEVGSRVNRLELAATRIQDLDLNLQEYRSDLQDVEFEEAVSRLAMAETAYRAALSATSRILGVNLTDYLR